MTKILIFAAICNRKRFSEWTHVYKIRPEPKCNSKQTGILKSI
jgi:hypothetical protein